MEKKYFLIIPLFFLVFSFLFPFKGGPDRHFVPATESSDTEINASTSYADPVPVGMIRTCYASKEGISASGFLDGTVLVDGKPLENRSEGKYKTVYAIAVSDDGKYLSVIAGVSPRTLFVYQKKQDIWTLIRMTNLEDDVRRVPFLAFSGNILLYEDAVGISVLNLTTFRHSTVEFSGTLKDVGYGPEQDYIWVVSADDAGKEQIHMFLYNGSLVASARYDGKENLSVLKVVEQ